MELHSCTNCELINEVITKEVQKYDMLTEENLALHSLLIKARENVASLETDVVKLYDAVSAERQRNLELHMKQLTSASRSEISTNIVTSGFREPGHKSFSLLRKTPTRASTMSSYGRDELVSISKFSELKNFCDDQAKIYEENLHILQQGNDNYISKLKQQIKDGQNHLMMMMEMYSKCRDELFNQKHANVDERKRFLETSDTLYRANVKYVQEVEKKMLSNNASAVTEQIKEFLNSISHQIEQRENLVATLRRQQLCLEEQIEKLKKQEGKLQEQRKKENDELRKQVRHFQQKCSALEQRRRLDAEGFCTDVDAIRKTIAKFKKFPPGLPALNKIGKKVDELDMKIRDCYAKKF